MSFVLLHNEESHVARQSDIKKGTVSWMGERNHQVIGLDTRKSSSIITISLSFCIEEETFDGKD